MWHSQERRDLGDGWYAVKLPSERTWTLKRNGVEYVQGRIQELEEWIEIRVKWRESHPKQTSKQQNA